MHHREFESISKYVSRNQSIYLFLYIGYAKISIAVVVVVLVSTFDED